MMCLLNGAIGASIGTSHGADTSATKNGSSRRKLGPDIEKKNPGVIPHGGGAADPTWMFCVPLACVSRKAGWPRYGSFRSRSPASQEDSRDAFAALAY